MINLLTKDVFNKISAGEVVERPASVVKELFENAVDAGATEIAVYIENGGISRIFVMDNGCGIDKDDLPKAYLPHATSKLKVAEDLDHIETLGFRGEALASIAAVAKCNISSKTADNEIGYRLSCEGGVMGELTETPCVDGTAVTVCDLFFNTPARLKFLKSEKSEENEVTALVEKLILSNPYVSVRYFVNDKIVYQSFGEGFKDSVLTVYGVEAVNNCYEISTNKNGLLIEGFIGNTNFLKGNRTYQTVIVNGRWVNDNTISTAMHNAYSSYLMKRQYPFYVLSVTLPSEFVDVNVHPRKTEVRFQNNQVVYGAVYSVVSKVLDGSADALDVIVNSPKKSKIIDDKPLSESTIISTPRDSFDIGADPKSLRPSKLVEMGYELPKAREVDYAATQEKYVRPEPILPSAKIAQSTPTEVKDFTDTSTVGDSAIDDVFRENKEYIEKLEKQKAKKAEQEQIDTDAPVTVVGQVLNTFLVLECGKDMILVDQHAAHERILYDNFCIKLKTNDVVKQTLLVPYTFRVNVKEADLLFERIEYFREIGIDLEAVDDVTFKVYSLPLDLVDMDFDAFFADVLNDTKFKEDKLPGILREKLAQKACKSAIKAGDKLSRSEINELLAMLKQNWGLKCPHGRPVCVKISETEIYKWFKRIV